jgi:TRAP transporter 4TM/12TM fusion protein
MSRFNSVTVIIWIRRVLTIAGIGSAIWYVFSLSPFRIAIGEPHYFYFLLACFLPQVFLNPKKPFKWWDGSLAAISFITPFYFYLKSWDIIYAGWDTGICTPMLAKMIGIVFLIIVLESGRRKVNSVFLGITSFFFFVPLLADHLPGFLRGHSYDFWGTLCGMAMGSEAVVGLPMKTIGQLLLGFLIFGEVFVVTGGGDFFIGLAMSLLGHVRGGAAKVSVVGSAMIGSITGSTITNVVTVGSITIPAMKKTGYSAAYAGAIEACASTGAVIQPPIMGATAFLIAQFLGVPYAKVMLAAFIPAFFYWVALFGQVDAYAVKNSLKGLPRGEIPSFWKTLREGWYYVGALAVLIYFITYQLMESKAPFFAILFLLVIAQIREKTRLKTKEQWWGIIDRAGNLVTTVLGTIAPLGFIIGALAITGIGHGFSSGVLEFAGGNIYLILFFCAVASTILGMGMTISACYIFLAVLVAPALVKAGFDPLAVHLFVMYWGMVSFITPPVSIAAYAAAAIAESPPMETGYRAMKLGMGIYFVPFFFILNPALIGNAPVLSVVFYFVTISVGVYLLAAAIEGYIPFINIRNRSLKSVILLRILVGIGAILLAIPESKTTVAGIVFTAILFGYIFLTKWIKGEKG